MPPFVSKLKRTFWEVTDLEKHNSNEDFNPYPSGMEVCELVKPDAANTIASLLEGSENLHAPSIDIDWHAQHSVYSDGQELDIWCKWPHKNKSGQPNLSTEEVRKYCEEIKKYNFVTSVLFDGNFTTVHYRFTFSNVPEMILLPSKSHDHFHLLMETIMGFDQYSYLLYLLNNLGIVQAGFLGMTKRRGMSHLRKPSEELFIVSQ